MGRRKLKGGWEGGTERRWEKGRMRRRERRMGRIEGEN